MSNSINPLRILLVEDNQVNQLVATAMLATQGYVIDVAENGVEGVKAVVNGEYDIVLMDIQMPEMNGVEATHEIRALEGDKSAVPIIAVTAHAMHGDRETYLAAGMNDYVSKPIDPKLLLDAIDRWAGRSGNVMGETSGDTPDQTQDRIING
jgi:two-component system, sensor histidine kinase and response regulator